MAITLADLIRQLPADTERCVRLTRDRARQPVREAVRAECGLSMRGMAAIDGGEAAVQVPINVLPGYPNGLSRLEFPDELAPVLLLAQYSQPLASIASAVPALVELNAKLRLSGFAADVALHSDQPLREVEAWSVRMLQLIERYDPLATLLRFEGDVLGAYHFKEHEGDEFKANGATIGLYWGVIGFVSQSLGCTIEDLTIVVLAHEVAHAYTQLGADTDGRRWRTDRFAKCELPLVEGLAQYYAERALKRLEHRYPKARQVFLQLLAKQPPAYHVHEVWAPHVAHEAVRRAMLEVRRNGELTLAEFEARLREASRAFLPAHRAEEPLVSDGYDG